MVFKFSKAAARFSAFSYNKPYESLSFARPVGFALGVGVISYYGCKQLHKWRETPQFVKECASKGQSSRAKVGNEVIFGFLAINAIVFGAWRIAANPGSAFARRRNMYSFMYKHFTHSPVFGKLHTLLLSNYSHSELWHLLANMVTFWSFGATMVQYLSYRDLKTRDYSYLRNSDALIANSGYELLFFIVSAGVVASLASHLSSNITLLAKVSRQAYQNVSAGGKLPWRAYSSQPLQLSLDKIPASLGASGIVWGIASYVATVNPQQRASIFFLPISFEMGYMAPFILCGELVAYYVFKYKTFDVAAHIGGALYGYMYAKFIRPALLSHNL